MTRIIDVDTHVCEPPDLWTSRMSESRWGDQIPRVVDDEERGIRRWKVGDAMVSPEGFYAMAGWREFPFPSHPASLAEADPAVFDPVARLARMDEYGVHAQVLYPNLAAFSNWAFEQLPDRAAGIECIRVWNDFLIEFAGIDRSRLIPVTALPYWDVEASVAELRRCAELGNTTILFGAKFERAGLPPLWDEHWNPILSAAQDLEQTVSVHIGFGTATSEVAQIEITKLAFTMIAPNTMLSGAATVSDIIIGGLCHRYPRLAWVSAESGIGWVPFLLESLDWQWKNTGVYREFPERMLPSEYFARQVYAAFWYEHEGISDVVRTYADNLLFQTDFPHPTSMSPGPASFAARPADAVAENLGSLPTATVEKIVAGNASRVYRIT